MPADRAIRVRSGNEDAVTDIDQEGQMPMMVEETPRPPEVFFWDQDSSESELHEGLLLVENRSEGEESSSEDDENFHGDDWEDINSDNCMSSEKSSNEDDFEFKQPVSFGDEFAKGVNNHQIKHNAVVGLFETTEAIWS